MKILISSRSFGKVDSGAEEILEKNGFEVILNPHGRKLNEDELIYYSEDVVGIIAGTETISKKVMENNPTLQVISRYGTGTDSVDLKAAEELGVIVRTTPNASSLAVAELTMSLILNLSRKICQMNDKVKSGTWKPKMGQLLTGKTIGIIGLGNIGKKLAHFLRPYNVNVLAYDTNQDKAFARHNNVKYESLQNLLLQSDIVTLHVPLTNKTRNIIGKKELSQMKDDAILINTARGGLMDESALLNVLKNKKLGGLAIDSFKREPYAGELTKFENVILTPHIGTYTTETRVQMEHEAVENLLNSLKEVRIT